MIAIIIPFYQIKKGPLSRSVLSILKQNCDADYKIVVIDDSSPIDAESELEPLASRLGDRLIVIKQPNGGPGAARNRGLDALDEKVSCVAFIDSDDEWEPGHLARVQSAFQLGADFFFSDYQRSGSSKTRFAETGLDPSMHRSLAKGVDLRWFTGNFFNILLRGAPVGTSTVAYNYRAFPKLRFHPRFWVGEDILFWMEVSQLTTRVIFSPKCSVHYGTGVNIFAGATWGTVSGMKRTLNSIRFHMLVSSKFPLTQEQSHWNSSFIRGLERDFIQSALVSAPKNEPGWKRLVWEYLKICPISITRTPMVVLQLLGTKYFS